MELSSMLAVDGSRLWTSVAVVYRECILKRSGEQLPHVARRIDRFLDDRTSSWTLSALYERTASPHCMRLLVDRRPAPEPLYREWEFNEVVAQAARNGDLSSLKWLAETYLPDGPLSSAANAAAASGELQILQWLHKVHQNRVHWGGMDWCEAIRGRQTDLIKWLREFVAPAPEATWKLVFDTAAAGYLELMQWLLTQDEAAVGAALRGACSGRQWGIVNWLATHCNPTPLADCVSVAAKDGDLLFLQWMHRKGLVHSFASAVPISAASGRLEILKWLYEEVEERELTADCMDQAASGGYLKVVEWLDARDCPATTSAMDGAAAAGFLGVMQWFHVNRLEGCTVAAMNGAAERGHLKVVKWLHTNRNEGCSVSAMEKAAGNGHLEVVQWLHSHRSEGCTERAMDWAAKGGHLNVVKWLHENRSEGCSTAAMNWAAYGGHLETMKWLHHNRSEGCTSKAMCLASAGGHLDILKWLQTIKGKPLGSHTVDMAAAGGHMRVLEWLYANGAASCTPSAMRDAVLGGHVPVMLFLYNNYGHEPCEEGICLLRDDWKDTELRFVGMIQWLMEKFGEELEGVNFSVNRADWATNKWMKEHSMNQIEVEDEIIFWECGPVTL
ncbi:unnamed protein product [Phytophthora lilii]|uniref:Unnamed protein product n=1 Tax=Phytophthora lilii TaxID=2077276 RepID=A0A9W6TAM9_9STRA|nr:unnamed protein product [Phytophthora lilii]